MQNLSPIKKIIKDTRFYAIARIIPSLLGFVAIIIYTRILSPEEYGLYILVITIISIVTAISFEWLNKSILRYFEESKKNKKLSEFISTIFGTLFATVATSLILWYIAIYLLQNHFSNTFFSMLKIGGLILISQGIYTFILSVKQSSQKSHEYGVYSILNSLGKLLIAIFFISILHFGPIGILLGMIICSGSISIYGILNLRTKYKIKLFYFSKKLFRKLLSYGYPLIGLSLASYVLVSVDRYMIKYFLNTSEVGIYSANYGLASGIIQPFLAILLLSAYPIIMETFENRGEKEASHVLNKILSIYFVILTPIVFGTTILSKNISNVLLGQSFRQGYIIIPLIVLGTFIFGLTQYFYKPFELKKKTKTLSLVVVIIAIINIILNFFFIPKFGIIGAAYTTLISYGFYLIITYLISKKIFRWKLPVETIIKSILASIFMCIVLHLIFPEYQANIYYLILKALIGAMSYFIIMLLAKEKNATGGFLYISNYLKKIFKNRNA